jgi:hypothetical protein
MRENTKLKLNKVTAVRVHVSVNWDFGSPYKWKIEASEIRILRSTAGHSRKNRMNIEYMYGKN